MSTRSHAVRQPFYANIMSIWWRTFTRTDLYNRHFGPHRMHAVHRCGLLLRTSHATCMVHFRSPTERDDFEGEYEPVIHHPFYNGLIQSWRLPGVNYDRMQIACNNSCPALAADECIRRREDACAVAIRICFTRQMWLAIRPFAKLL